MTTNEVFEAAKKQYLSYYAIFMDVSSENGDSLEDSANKHAKETAKRHAAARTMRERIIVEQQAQGWRLVGETTGLVSNDPKSKMQKLLARVKHEHRITCKEFRIETAARAGRAKNDGYQILIFGNFYAY